MELGIELHGGSPCNNGPLTPPSEEDTDLRRGPWTVEEDLLLINYVAAHGEGRWNSLAHCAGLRRTGKSCRLRWLNYLRPDVRRGNITPEEQLLILELHSRWGNRWSKIAQHLPGRTDNEIKNYWRTRVQKHAKQLKCDVNSKQFKDVMRYLWVPRLMERIRAASARSPAAAAAAAYENTVAAPPLMEPGSDLGQSVNTIPCPSQDYSSSGAASTSDSIGVQFLSSASISAADRFMDASGPQVEYSEYNTGDRAYGAEFAGSWPEPLPGPGGFADFGPLDFEFGGWVDNLWGVEDVWLQQQ